MTTPQIASEAFALAIQNLQDEFRGDLHALEWLRECSYTSFDSLLEVTSRAEIMYTESIKGKGKVMRFIRGLSNRIMLYGKVFDTMAQHHPEYLAFVWGLMKFILMGIINHAKLVEHFSQAITLIAEVLPTVDISADLYRTDRMKNAVANLYAHILLFLRQAAKWYQMGPAGRALTSLFKPFELTYKDTVENIRICTQSINQIASISAKVETREIREVTRRIDEQSLALLEMQNHFSKGQSELNDKVATILQIITCDTSKLSEIHTDVKSMHPLVVDTHFKQVLDCLRVKRSPERDLQKHRSLIRRSAPWRNNRINYNTTIVLKTITEWISSPTSSLVVLQAHARAHTRVKEIATQVIDHLQHKDKPAIWYLSTLGANENQNEDQPTTVDLVKSLISQLMSADPTFVRADPGNFNVAKLNAPHSSAEWLEFLKHILRNMPRTSIILEAEDVFRDEEAVEDLNQLLRALAEVTQEPGSCIKILMVNYWSRCRTAELHGDQTRVRVVDVEREAPVPPRLRKAGNRSVFGRRLEM